MTSSESKAQGKSLKVGFDWSEGVKRLVTRRSCPFEGHCKRLIFRFFLIESFVAVIFKLISNI